MIETNEEEKSISLSHEEKAEEAYRRKKEEYLGSTMAAEFKMRTSRKWHSKENREARELDRLRFLQRCLEKDPYKDTVSISAVNLSKFMEMEAFDKADIPIGKIAGPGK